MLKEKTNIYQNHNPISIKKRPHEMPTQMSQHNLNQCLTFPKLTFRKKHYYIKVPSSPRQSIFIKSANLTSKEFVLEELCQLPSASLILIRPLDFVRIIPFCFFLRARNSSDIIISEAAFILKITNFDNVAIRVYC